MVRWQGTLYQQLQERRGSSRGSSPAVPRPRSAGSGLSGAAAQITTPSPRGVPSRGAPRGGAALQAPPQGPPGCPASQAATPRPAHARGAAGTSPGEGQRPSPMGSAGFRTPEFAGASLWAGGGGGGDAGRMPAARPRGGRAAAPVREAQGRSMEGGAQMDSWKCRDCSLIEKQRTVHAVPAGVGGPGFLAGRQGFALGRLMGPELERSLRVGLCWERGLDAAGVAQPGVAAGMFVSRARRVAGPAAARAEAVHAEGVRVLRSRSVASPAMPAPSAYTESLGTGARAAGQRPGCACGPLAPLPPGAFVHWLFDLVPVYAGGRCAGRWSLALAIAGMLVVSCAHPLFAMTRLQRVPVLAFGRAAFVTRWTSRCSCYRCGLSILCKLLCRSCCPTRSCAPAAVAAVTRGT